MSWRKLSFLFAQIEGIVHESLHAPITYLELLYYCKWYLYQMSKQLIWRSAIYKQ